MITCTGRLDKLESRRTDSHSDENRNVSLNRWFRRTKEDRLNVQERQCQVLVMQAGRWSDGFVEIERAPRCSSQGVVEVPPSGESRLLN